MFAKTFKIKTIFCYIFSFVLMPGTIKTFKNIQFIPEVQTTLHTI